MSWPGLRRRALLLAGLAPGTPAWALPPRTLHFPRDHGAHPEHRTEWWYLTGQARSGRDLFGFQLTFFRSRVEPAQALRSSLAARQLILAHAALTDVAQQRLWHDQRLHRSLGPSGQGPFHVSAHDTDIALRDWQLRRDGARYLARMESADFGLDLELHPSQPLLLQGHQGLSRKGPHPSQASYYYSLPQLQVRGTLRRQGRTWALDSAHPGTAWLDHEWSDALMPPNAVGWDWIGINLFDGSALTAFRLRDRQGQTVWDGGSLRQAGQTQAHIFESGQTRFTPQRHWRSAASQTLYPVQWQVQCPAGVYTVRALLDNQELDSRATTGAIYWEGLSELLDLQGRPVGHGYLEMTGYASPLRLG